MPFSEMFEFVNLNIPKCEDGSASGFELDIRQLMKLAEVAKSLCKDRETLLSPYRAHKYTVADELMEALDGIDEFVAWFYPATQVPGVTTRLDADDLPTVEMHSSPNRAQRREMHIPTRKVRQTFKDGEWVTE